MIVGKYSLIAADGPRLSHSWQRPIGYCTEYTEREMSEYQVKVLHIEVRDSSIVNFYHVTAK